MYCVVCGKSTDWFEPRFGYYACEEHQSLSPVYIGQLAKWFTAPHLKCDGSKGPVGSNPTLPAKI